MASAQWPGAITIEPENATAWDTITLKLNINKSCNSASFDTVSQIYMHSGVNINGDRWQNVVDFDATGANGQAATLTKENDSIWSIKYVPVEFYDVAYGNFVLEINGVFNNGTWDVKAADYNADSSECVDFNIPIAYSPVTMEPQEANAWQEVTLTLNTSFSCPDGAMDTVSKVFIHSGVTIDGSAWQNVVDFDATGANGQSAELSKVSDSLWSITYIPADFYGVEEGSIVSAINMVFNNGTWDAEGKMTPYDSTMSCMDITVPLETNIGIGENVAQNTFKMYPNPVTHILNITDLENVNRIEIFNTTGQRIQEIDVNNETIQIETENFENGIYFVNFYDEKGVVATQKFIK